MKDVSGWFCPRCKVINSPFVERCNCKEVKLEGKVEIPYTDWGRSVDDIFKGCKPYRTASRTINCLMLNNTTTAQELSMHTWKQLKSIPKIGTGCIALMRNRLNELNIILEER